MCLNLCKYLNKVFPNRKKNVYIKNNNILKNDNKLKKFTKNIYYFYINRIRIKTFFNNNRKFQEHITKEYLSEHKNQENTKHNKEECKKDYSNTVEIRKEHIPCKTVEFKDEHYNTTEIITENTDHNNTQEFKDEHSNTTEIITENTEHKNTEEFKDEDYCII